MDIRLDNGNSTTHSMDIYILTNPKDQACYENAILMQDWNSQCSFLTSELTDGTVVAQGVTSFTHILANYTLLQQVDLKNTKVYIDNSPFPDGIVRSFEPLTVFVMKENIYTTTSILTTVASSLILIFVLIFAVIVGQSVKLHRVWSKFKKDQEGFKNAYDLANGNPDIGGGLSTSNMRVGNAIGDESRVRAQS